MLTPRLPKIINIASDKKLFAQDDKGKNIEANNNPQKINPLFEMLSAKKPKIGCTSCENNCEILINNVATPIEIPIFAAINGIIGFKNPE